MSEVSDEAPKTPRTNSPNDITIVAKLSQLSNTFYLSTFCLSRSVPNSRFCFWFRAIATFFSDPPLTISPDITGFSTPTERPAAPLAQFASVELKSNSWEPEFADECVWKPMSYSWIFDWTAAVSSISKSPQRNVITWDRVWNSQGGSVFNSNRGHSISWCQLVIGDAIYFTRAL